MEGRGTIRFMGQHELQLVADFDWAEDGAFTGCIGLTKGLKLAIEGKRVV